MTSMRARLRSFVLALGLMCTLAARVSTAQPGAPGTVLRITVLDQTDAAFVTAQVTVLGSAGPERTISVNAGVAIFDGLTPGTYQVRVAAEGFRTARVSVAVKRGQNQTTIRLALAGIEQTVAARFKRGHETA